MKITLSLGLIFMFAVPTWTQDTPEDFVVEQLTPTEVREIQVAAKELAMEQVNYNMGVAKIRFAHGQSAGTVFWACNALVVSVEIKGKYAMITKRRDTSSCPVAAGSGTGTRP